jgi:type I restriction enzyme S subunit
LGDVAEYINGRAFKPTDWETSGRPIIRIQNLTSSTDTINRYSQSVDEKFLIKDGDFLISWSATLGAFIYKGEEAVLNQHIFKVKPYINKLFLFYLVNAYIDSLKKKVHGTGMQHITKGKFEESPIPLPSAPEQIRIVSKIEELLTELDAGVASLKKVQAQLKRYRQAVLKAAFEGRLTQEWRKEHKGEIESADVLFKKIRKEHPCLEKEIAKRLPLDDSELFSLPNEWIWVQAQDVCENISNGYTPTADKLFEGDGDIPFIKVYNLTKTGAFDFSIKPTFICRKTHESELRRSAVYPDDILMSIVGPPMGKVSLVPESHDEWNINQAIVIYRTFPGYFRKLMLYVILSETIQKWLKKRGKTTAGQTNYTITMSRSLPVPLPPFEEQSIIVDEIERHFSQIDHIENIVETSFRQAETLRQSILKQAFEGKLVPQDPNDEPASILLERIKAEKARHVTEAKKGKTLQPKSPKRKIKNAN